MKWIIAFASFRIESIFYFAKFGCDSMFAGGQRKAVENSATFPRELRYQRYADFAKKKAEWSVDVRKIENWLTFPAMNIYKACTSMPSN